MVGFGMSGDAYHVTAPPEDGEGARKAMAGALTDAQLNPEQVQYVNAHATSTELGDRAETLAIRRAFGAAADQLAVSSTKVHDRTLAGRSRRGRGNFLGAGVVRPSRAADHQSAPAGRGLRPGLRAEYGAANVARITPFPIHSGSVAPTVRSFSAGFEPTIGAVSLVVLLLAAAAATTVWRGVRSLDTPLHLTAPLRFKVPAGVEFRARRGRFGRAGRGRQSQSLDLVCAPERLGAGRQGGRIRGPAGHDAARTADENGQRPSAAALVHDCRWLAGAGPARGDAAQSGHRRHAARASEFCCASRRAHGEAGESGHRCRRTIFARDLSLHRRHHRHRAAAPGPCGAAARTGRGLDKSRSGSAAAQCHTSC